MDALEYLIAFGPEAVRALCLRAETTYEYYSQIANGHRRPSVELAERLVAGSDGKLDFVRLMKAKKRAAPNQEAA